jgi:hypothetical protein
VLSTTASTATAKRCLRKAPSPSTSAASGSMSEKDKRKAKEVDGAWLKDYVEKKGDKK